MKFNTLNYEVKDRILTLTLNRPEQMNAFTLEMCDELKQAFKAADADDEIRVIVVTGAGKAFCAGMDLSTSGNKFGLPEGADIHANPEAIRDTGGTVTLAIYDCTKPVIAAINGAAVGIGITMTLAMDIRLATPDAKLGFVFTQRGVANEACSSWFLPRIVGPQQALEWLYTGEIFSGEEGCRGGLIRSVHPQEELLEAAYTIARKIATRTSAVSVALARQMVYKMMGADHPIEAHQIDSLAMYYTSFSHDGKEGVDSFMEKRPAVFTDSMTRNRPPFYPWWEPRQFTIKK